MLSRYINQNICVLTLSIRFEAVQIGLHFTEVGPMLSELSNQIDNERTPN